MTHNLACRVSIPDDSHPGIGGNQVDVAETALLVGNTLVVGILWDAGYSEPWLETHVIPIPPEKVSSIATLQAYHSMKLVGEHANIKALAPVKLEWVPLHEAFPDFVQEEMPGPGDNQEGIDDITSSWEYTLRIIW